MKLKNRWILLSTGFAFGVSFVIACGGGSNTIAQAIGNAFDVLFDNSSSGLGATNVQEAIDELNNQVRAIQTGGQVPLNQSDIVGNWNGMTFGSRGNYENINLNLNADGSYSCSGQSVANGITNQGIHDQNSVCLNPVSWLVLKKAILLNYLDNGQSRNVAYPVNYLDNSNLEILTGEDAGQPYVTELSK